MAASKEMKTQKHQRRSMSLVIRWESIGSHHQQLALMAFRRWGKILDTFVPRTKDAPGCTFAFVRLSNGDVLEELFMNSTDI